MENNITQNISEKEKKTIGETEIKDPTQQIISGFKKNYKLIILIVIVVTLISYMNTNTSGNFIKSKTRFNSHGGFYTAAEQQNMMFKQQTLYQGIAQFKEATSKCTAGMFSAGIGRFSTISENILSVLVIIAAIIIIPAFPVVIYIAIVYAIIYKMSTRFTKI
jgi:hypothetical protein